MAHHILREAEEPIVAALREVGEIQEDKRPFVIIESGPHFVQFAASTSKLVFDVPALSLLRFISRLPGWQTSDTILREAAREAIETLFQLGVSPGNEVTIRIGETHRADKRGAPN